MSDGAATVVAASDLADYAYCPRSHYYRHHPPPGGAAPDAERRAQAGVRVHARQLSGERHRAVHGGWYWVALGLGVVAIVLGLAVWH